MPLAIAVPLTKPRITIPIFPLSFFHCFWIFAICFFILLNFYWQLLLLQVYLFCTAAFTFFLRCFVRSAYGFGRVAFRFPCFLLAFTGCTAQFWRVGHCFKRKGKD